MLHTGRDTGPASGWTSMTQPSISTPKFEMSNANIIKWVIVALLVVVAIVAMTFARRVIGPLDNLVTSQTCGQHGREELSRESVDYEASNRFAITNRSDGFCVFGPVVEFDEDGEVIVPEVDAEAADGDEAAAASEVAEERLQISLADIETGRFYDVMKIVFVLLQLGAASAAVRLLADPLFDRFVRRSSDSPRR